MVLDAAAWRKKHPEMQLALERFPATSFDTIARIYPRSR